MNFQNLCKRIIDIMISLGVEINEKLVNMVNSSDEATSKIGIQIFLKEYRHLLKYLNFSLEFSGYADSVSDVEMIFHDFPNTKDEDAELIEKIKRVINDEKYLILDTFDSDVRFDYYNDDGGGGTILIDFLNSTSRINGYENYITQRHIAEYKIEYL